MATTVKNNFPVTGMSCAACASSVESMLNSQPGVIAATVNFAASSVWVEYQTGETNPTKFREALQSVGYDLLFDEAEVSNRTKSSNTNRLF